MEAKNDLKYIAFYLPQFHPIEENDKAWGKGFTEWTNVTKAKPLFKDHYQPRRPADLGYYDLRLKEVQKQQIELAKKYNIFGFCYYYYWFNGKKVLETPIENVLSDKTLDLPFCICYANENWTKKWDGGKNEIILEQQHSPEDDKNFINEMINFFKDSRYIKIDNKPLLLIYRTALFPNIQKTVEIYRNEVKKAGFQDLYLCQCESFSMDGKNSITPESINFDANYEFPPHSLGLTHRLYKKEIKAKFQSKYFQGQIFDYNESAAYSITKKLNNYKFFRGIFLGWDNTARRATSPAIFHGFSLKKFEEWLTFISIQTVERLEPFEQFIFINAWNEWAEGTYLEPDEFFGHEYLRVIRRSYNKTNQFFAPTNKKLKAEESKKDQEINSILKTNIMYLKKGNLKRIILKLTKRYIYNKIKIFLKKNMAPNS